MKKLLIIGLLVGIVGNTYTYRSLSRSDQDGRNQKTWTPIDDVPLRSSDEDVDGQNSETWSPGNSKHKNYYFGAESGSIGMVPVHVPVLRVKEQVSVSDPRTWSSIGRPGANPATWGPMGFDNFDNYEFEEQVAENNQ